MKKKSWIAGVRTGGNVRMMARHFGCLEVLCGFLVVLLGCLKGGGLRNVDLVRPLMLNKKISRTFQVNLSAKTRTSPFQDVSLVHSSKCRSKGERFCHLADLGDLALFSCTRNR